MKLAEAKKLLQRDLDDPGSVDISDLNQAQQLGIEALSYIDICQKNPNCFNISLLPGQTKD